MTKTHQLSKHPLYGVRNGMKQRCGNSNNGKFKNYGARGIKVCEDWANNFENFYKWAMANGYKQGLTIDRIDVNGDYCPENCRWVSQKVQQNNRRNNHLITCDGVTHTLAEWSALSGIHELTINRRLENGVPPEIAIRVERIKDTRITINGETDSMNGWNARMGYSNHLVSSRVERGWDPVKAVLTPPRKGNYTHAS